MMIFCRILLDSNGSETNPAASDRILLQKQVTGLEVPKNALLLS